MTKRREDFPKYQAAVQAFLAGDAREFRALARSEGLTRSERKLLEARARFRREEWSEAFELLTTMGKAGFPFLEADRQFLLASAHFALGRIEAAAACNISAAELYREVGDRRGRFIALYNAMVDFSRLGHNALAQLHFEQASAFAQGAAEETVLWRAMACEESRLRRYDEACRWLDRASERVAELNHVDRHVHFAVAADIYARAGRFDAAIRALESIRATRTQTEARARLDFELGVLLALTRETSLGEPSNAVAATAEFGLKWNFLRSLEQGEIDRADRLWKDLCAMFPGIFGSRDGYACLDPSEEDTSFWRCVRRLRHRARPVAPPKGKVGDLYRELLGARHPVRKELLIERIWKIPYDPRWDSRLYKLVERAKRERIPIVSAQRAYRLGTLRD